MNNKHRHTLLYLWLILVFAIYFLVIIGGILIARFIVHFLAGA